MQNITLERPHNEILYRGCDFRYPPPSWLPEAHSNGGSFFLATFFLVPQPQQTCTSLDTQTQASYLSCHNRPEIHKQRRIVYLRAVGVSRVVVVTPLKAMRQIGRAHV
jgi:hypothetical protein